jgi:hypothetical protein
MRGWAAGSVVAALGIVPAGWHVAGVQADGALPQAPYRYLHPPHALARTNKKPNAGAKTVALNRHHRSIQFVLFTGDGQAGIGAHTGAFNAPSPARSIRVVVRPVDTPHGLPRSVAVYGNAYSISAVGQPGNKPVKVLQPLGLAFRWPPLRDRHPNALYAYSGKHWRRICGHNSLQVSPGYAFCNVSTLGTMVVAADPPHH